MMPAEQTITVLLRELAGGEKEAFDRLMPLVYRELRRLAQSQLRNERPGHTLQPTALVHEVYARMVGAEQLSFNDRAHFLCAAALSMRQVLIDHARIRNAAKRGHGQPRIALDEARDIGIDNPAILIALGDALDSLEKQNPTMARLIELRYFGGLTAAESGAALNLEVNDVRRILNLGQAWLRRQLATR